MHKELFRTFSSFHKLWSSLDMRDFTFKLYNIYQYCSTYLNLFGMPLLHLFNCNFLIGNCSLFIASVVITSVLITSFCFLCSSYIPDIRIKTGVTIPAGAVMVVPVQLVQMDDLSWGQDASEFNPYRFLSKAENQSDLVLDTSCRGFTPT